MFKLKIFPLLIVKQKDHILAQLEKSAGVQVVRRTTRRVEPTEVGLRLYAHGRAIQNEMLAARETIATLGQGLQGC